MLPTGCFDGNKFNYFLERSFLWIMDSFFGANTTIYELRYDRYFGSTYDITDPIYNLIKENPYPSNDSSLPTSLGGYSIRCVKE